jgi:M6 family metalloprotease-like protein
MLSLRLSLLLSAAALFAVNGIAPPHPDFLEEYSRKRRRLQLARNTTASYKPVHIARQLCQDLSDHECRQLDERTGEHHEKVRRLVQSTGRLKTLVLLARFQDHVDRPLPSRDEINLLWNAAEGEAPDYLLPTGSISDYLRRNSYGNLQLEADVMDWALTDNTELYYSFNVSGLTRDFASAMYPLLRVLDALGTDFSQYDVDGDGVLDSVVMLHSGFPAEVGGIDCYNSRPDENRIWSHSVTSFANQWISFDGKYTLGAYMISAAMRGTCGSSLARIGVMTHEFIHTWGIPDLYDTSVDAVGKGIGTFDIMSNPYGLDGAQIYPNNMGPWTKMQSGWLNPIEITQDGQYFIEASALNPSVFVIHKKFPDDEYILIENRIAEGWDALLWGGGLLIWHIDDNADNNNNRGFPGQFGWPGNGNHYRVAVAAGDRNYDLEKGNNNGDEWDFWLTGQELSPGLFEFEATDFSQYPNTNSYMFGSIFPTGIRIYNISNPGSVMSFMVQGISPATPPTPNPSWSPTPPPTPLPTWSPSMAPTRKPTPEPGRPTESPSLRSSGSPTVVPPPSATPVTTPVVTPEPPGSITASATESSAAATRSVVLTITFSFFFVCLAL